MPRRDNSKNLTFVEVIIVVFVCLFLLAVVPPAFQQTRTDASRITCNRNLSKIGKAMIIYANDYDDKLPRAGGRNSVWAGHISNWMADNRFAAYGLGSDGSGGLATITSSFYLLVKYAEVSPKSFICPGDEGATEFKPTIIRAGDRELIDFWDFGLEPSKHCSYSYHMPYGLYALTTSSDPGMAVAADRNPWIRSPSGGRKSEYLLINYNPNGGKEAVKIGNTIAHEEEGQNVLFLDGHVNFEESPLCGINGDNIYTYWGGDDRRRGGYPIPRMSEPSDRMDSYLVNEPTANKTITTKEIKNINSADLKETSIVATLDCPIPEHKNVIWCSTFQMAWDKFKNDILGEPVKVHGAEELAARLNHAEVSEADIEKESFYATAGFVKNDIIEEIQTEMKKRFPSARVPIFHKSYRSPDVIVTYSYLNIDLEFKYPFFTKNSAFIFEDTEGTHTKVTSFRNIAEGMGDSNSEQICEQVCEQVDILYYKSGNRLEPTEFAIDLCKYTSPYQVVLARVSRRNTLGSTVATVEQKISEFKENPGYEVLRKLRPPIFGPGDIVIVPDVLYKLTHQFTELKDRLLGNSQLPRNFILEALQMIDFSLSRTGVILKSEAVLVLYFNRPFLIYVKKRQGGTNPFFVMWVDNAELMQEFESK